MRQALRNIIKLCFSLFLLFNFFGFNVELQVQSVIPKNTAMH